MSDDNAEDVPAFLAALPVGAVFTHGTPGKQPDSWIKTGRDSFRRTYHWVRFTADDFADWTHVELTTPVSYSITQEEADKLETEARAKPPRTEMGG
ncbi:hypothetical protein [Leifsonia sp. NPDC058230]|uniref:hypothetical protein n=1 Tax=Leifsonia sp. NPDC058230 TaxID=3346391 RepID=UPI0036DF01E2